MKLIPIVAILLVSVSLTAQTPTPQTITPLTKQQAKEQAKQAAYLKKHPLVTVYLQPAVSNPMPEETAEQKAIDKRNYDERVKENLQVIATQQRNDKQKDCLTSLKAGDSAAAVYHCGSPDHVNSDLNTDQLVFSNGVIVYIGKSTDRVQDVQWTN